jgi:hypothetical protein
MHTGSYKFTFADCLMRILKQNYPNLNLSRANKIIRDSVAIMHENSYNIFKEADYNKFCVRLFSLNKPDISVLPKEDIIAYCESYLLNKIIQETVRDETQSTPRIGFFSTQTVDHELKEAIAEIVRRADWPEIKTELFGLSLPSDQLKVLVAAFAQHEITPGASSQGMSHKK